MESDIRWPEIQEEETAEMIKKLYRRIFFTYNITVFLLVTAIVCFIALHDSSALRDQRQLLSQSYINNILLELQHDVAISDTVYRQYHSHVPMDLLIIREGTSQSFLSDEIKTPFPVLEAAIRERFQQAFEQTYDRESEKEAGEYQIPNHLFAFEMDGRYGESFYCFRLTSTSVTGKNYELLAVCLINKNLFSIRQIGLLGGLELLLFLSFWFLGKHIIQSSIAPVNENMQRQKEFIAAASHELKTPLSKIVIANSSKTYDGKQMINRECECMDKIIKELLFLASGESCTWQTNLAETDLVNLCAEFYELSTPILRKSRKELQFDLPEGDIAPVRLDRTLILQLLTILLDNAVTYSGGSKPILIRLVRQKKFLFLSFIDHGAGISDTDKQKIFSSFYKVDASMPGHYGLGLSIAKKIAELHHGNISVSDTPGGGATFTVTLPC